MTASPDVGASPSVLLIDATSRAGLEIIQELILHPTKPQIHAFCRNATTLPGHFVQACKFVYEGDSTRAVEVLKALKSADADVVILSVGKNERRDKSFIRTGSAWAVASAMKMPGMEHVRAVVLSSAGAGSSRIKLGMGLGKLLEHRLRYVLKDHTGQEMAFLKNGLAERTVIVRPTPLRDGKAIGKGVEFRDKDRPPSMSTDRGNVAKYIVKEACESTLNGMIVNITDRKYIVKEACASTLDGKIVNITVKK